jgi:hypothetical protein
MMTQDAGPAIPQIVAPLPLRRLAAPVIGGSGAGLP